ncbi:MAG: ABC transporter ATP-binding protein [Rhodobacteraceae bacterium]|jgi:ABC-2 type transport system ATP-binding protein|nr:ABC transporter ATP-binding protein [Paracoccaceae bacterium]
MSILNVKDLKKSYLNPDTKEKFNAVDGISFEIETTQIYGILGPNGAGKTTTLEMVEGLTDIDGGFACVNGLDVAENPYKVKEIIGVQLQSNEYFDSLSLKELLILFGKLYKNNVNVNDLLNSVDLLDKVNAKPEELSGGQKQRFSIACALVNQPLVLFLDEPTTGLDPQAKHNLWKLIKKLNLSGMTIILTTHNMEEAEKLCHKVAIMDKGKIMSEGSPKDLIAKFDSENAEKGNLENVFLHLTGRGLRE